MAQRTAALAALRSFASANGLSRAALPAASAVGQVRHQSSAPVPADQAALNMVNAAPGRNLAQKTGFITVAASLAAYAISKEIYILDVETFEAIPMIGAFAFAYINLKDGFADILETQKKRIHDILAKAREDHKAVVEERLEHVGKLGDVVDITKNLYQVSREIASMEAEAYELKQRVALTNEVRATLDAWVRYEATVRERRQREVAQHVIDQVTRQLESDEAQEHILKQAIRDVERITKRA